MFRIVKIIQNDADVFLVINVIKNKEVARFDTYKEATTYVLSN